MENKKFNLGEVKLCDPRFVANKSDLYSIIRDNVHDCDIIVRGDVFNDKALHKVVDVVNLIPWNIFYIYDGDNLVKILYDFVRNAKDRAAARLTLYRVAHEFRASKTGIIEIKGHQSLTEDIYKCLRSDWYISSEYEEEIADALGYEFAANHSIKIRDDYRTTTNLTHNTSGSHVDPESLFVIQLRNIFRITDDRYKINSANLWIHKALADFLAKINMDGLKVDETKVPEKYRGSEFGIKLAAVLPFVWAGPRDITKLDYKLDTVIETLLPKIQEDIDKLLANPDKLEETVIDRFNIYILHIESQQPDKE